MFHALPRLYFKTGWTLVETTLKREELWVFEEQHTHIALLLSAVTALNQICFAELQQSHEIAFFDLVARDYRERYLWRPHSLFKITIQRLPFISHHAFGIAIFNSFKIFCSQEVKDMKARWIWQTLWKQILSPWWGTSCEHRGFIPGGGDVRQTASMINCHTEFVSLVSLKVDSFIFMCHLPSSKTFPAKIAK